MNKKYVILKRNKKSQKLLDKKKQKKKKELECYKKNNVVNKFKKIQGRNMVVVEILIYQMV